MTQAIDPSDLTILLSGGSKQLLGALEQLDLDVESAEPAATMEMARVLMPDMVVLMGPAAMGGGRKVREALDKELDPRPVLIVVGEHGPCARAHGPLHTWVGVLDARHDTPVIAEALGRIAERVAAGQGKNIRELVASLLPPMAPAPKIGLPVPSISVQPIAATAAKAKPITQAKPVTQARPATQAKPKATMIGMQAPAPAAIGATAKPAAAAVPVASRVAAAVPAPAAAQTITPRRQPASHATAETRAARVSMPTPAATPKLAAEPPPQTPVSVAPILMASEPPVAHAMQGADPEPAGVQRAVASEPPPPVEGLDMEVSIPSAPPPPMIQQAVADAASPPQPPAATELEVPPGKAGPSPLGLALAKVRAQVNPALVAKAKDRAGLALVQGRALASRASAAMGPALSSARASAQRMPRWAMAGGALAVLGLIVAALMPRHQGPVALAAVEILAAPPAPEAAQPSQPEAAGAVAQGAEAVRPQGDDGLEADPETAELAEESDQGLDDLEQGATGDPESGITSTRGMSRKARKLAAANGLVAQGHRLRKRGKLGMAEAYYLKATRVWPSYPRAMAGLARVHLQRRDGVEALRWAKKLVAAQPKRSNNQLILGDAHRMLGHKNAAKAAWRQSVRYGNRVARRRLKL